MIQIRRAKKSLFQQAGRPYTSLLGKNAFPEGTGGLLSAGDFDLKLHDVNLSNHGHRNALMLYHKQKACESLKRFCIHGEIFRKKNMGKQTR